MRIEKSALVPYRPEEMYELVRDIKSYPDFLPWCRTAKIRSQQEDAVVASLELVYSGIHKWFTTRNQMDAPGHIQVRLVEGPFRHLEGDWRFQPLGKEACKVHLVMEFEFAGLLLSRALGPIFERIANTFVDSFCKRAVQVYGPRTLPG